MNIAYRCWQAMKQRCNNKECPNYQNYGVKGITVCERWMESFENFLEDMGERPSLQHSIDRIDSSKGYYPENCRWATSLQQGERKKNCKYLTINGETMNISAWARKVGIGKMTIANRIKWGWSDYDAVYTPVKEDIRYDEKVLIPKLLELGIKVEDIAYILKVKPNAIYKQIKKLENESR